MNPSVKRAVLVAAGVVCGALAYAVFPSDATTHDALVKAAIALFTMGGVTVHDAGHVSILGIPFGGARVDVVILCLTTALALSGFTGCLGKNGPVKDDPVWGPVSSCAAAGASDAVAEVTDALLNNDTAALEKLAVTYGKDVVACLIKSLTDQWLAPGAAPDPHRLDAAKRGQGFLRAKGVTFPQAWLFRGWVPVPYAYAGYCHAGAGA